MIDIVGRLPLLIASTVFMSLALAGFGSYAYYVSQTQNPGYVDSTVVGQHDWIPLLCVLVFTTALALGISPISWLLIGELFPLEYRGLGSSISTSFSYFCAFFGIKLFMDFQQVNRFSFSSRDTSKVAWIIKTRSLSTEIIRSMILNEKIHKRKNILFKQLNKL